MQGYMQQQWLDDDAVAWASQGIEANDAYLWHELGLTPLEAARLSVQGRAPGEVIREWWRAGIPFDEVADWIGAGLSADEATDQRAKGITAEHAAALRALRHDEDPPPRTGLPSGSPMRRGPPRATPTGPPPETRTLPEPGSSRHSPACSPQTRASQRYRRCMAVRTSGSASPKQQSD
jgi:hypothetical protein